MCKVKTKFTVTLFFLVMLFVFITTLRSNANMRINIARATTGGSYHPGRHSLLPGLRSEVAIGYTHLITYLALLSRYGR